MATKLTKAVVREVSLKDANGLEGPVVVTLNATGLELRAKGKQRKLNISFADLNKVLVLPPNVPTKYTGNPLSWLVEGNEVEPVKDESVAKDTVDTTASPES